MTHFDDRPHARNSAPVPGLNRTAEALADAIASRCEPALREANKDKSAILRALADWPILADAGARHGIDPGLLAAVGVRESGYRNVAQPNGRGRGVFQIDLGQNPGVTRSDAMNVAWAADWAARRLSSDFKYFQNRFPSFTKEQAMQAAVAAYNFGRGNVSGNPATIDRGTTGDNYGRNVLAIADCF